MELSGAARLPICKRLSGVLLLLWACHDLHAQTSAVGDIARDFTLTNHMTGLPVRLSDYAGEIIVLDFFTYWCAFCQESSPVIEEQIQQYYQGQKGNPSGFPVRVISVNLEAQNTPGTDRFIQGAGLDLVADDFARTAYNQFVFPAERVATLFVVISGVANANYRQWEVLYRTNTFEGISPLRNTIDSVQHAVGGAPSITSGPLSATVASGASVSFSVVAAGNPPLIFQWFKNGSLLLGATNSNLTFQAGSRNTGAYSVTVSNSIGLTRSGAGILTVIVPARMSNLRYYQGAVAFDMTGAPGQSYKIQASSDIINWATVASVQSTNGNVTFQDFPVSPARFYRAVVP